MKTARMIKRLSCLLLCAVMLTGCNPGQRDYGDEYVFEQDDQIVVIRSLGPNATMARAENGYFFYRPGSPFVFFWPGGDSQAKPICGKPNCLHEKETDREKRKECDAFILSEGIGKTIVYNNSRLYYTQGFSENIYDEQGNQIGFTTHYELWEMSADGTGRKSVCRLDGEPSSFIIHRGFLYYTYGEYPELSPEGEQIGERKAYVCKVNLNAWNKDTEVLCEKSAWDVQYEKLTAKGNEVYFVERKSPEGAQASETALLKYNIMTGEINQILSGVSTYGFHGNQLVYYKDLQIFLTDSDGGNGKKLADFNGNMSADEDYIYLDDLSGELDDRTFSIMDYNGKVLQTLTLTNYDKGCFSSNDEYLFFKDMVDDYQTSVIYAAKKSQIESGEPLELVKLYESPAVNEF